MTDLAGFIASPARDEWITDSGLSYYVRKSLFFPDLIELANCTALNDTGLNYWRFNKRHSATVPFIAEQVLNVGLARFYQRQGWIARDGGEGIPTFASPLAVKRYGATERFAAMRFDMHDPITRLAAWMRSSRAMTKRKYHDGYYVTAKQSPDGYKSQTAWLCGPFTTHKAALAMVPAVRYAARRLTDPRFEFASYGTSKLTVPIDKPLPAGRLDLTKSVDDGWISRVIDPWAQRTFG